LIDRPFFLILLDKLKIDEKSNSKEQNKHSSCEAEPKDKFRRAKFFFFAVLARKSAFTITFVAIQRVSSTIKARNEEKSRLETWKNRHFLEAQQCRQEDILQKHRATFRRKNCSTSHPHIRQE
jgi:hypothetical protein